VSYGTTLQQACSFATESDDMDSVLGAEEERTLSQLLRGANKVAFTGVADEGLYCRNDSDSGLDPWSVLWISDLDPDPDLNLLFSSMANRRL
jgi:hypothetical protein